MRLSSREGGVRNGVSSCAPLSIHPAAVLLPFHSQNSQEETGKSLFVSPFRFCQTFVLAAGPIEKGLQLEGLLADRPVFPPKQQYLEQPDPTENPLKPNPPFSPSSPSVGFSTPEKD